MSTPYWGQLPGPRVAKNRSLSDDFQGISPLDRSAVPGRSNGPPAQTAAAESFFSPAHEPPTTSDFLPPSGLAISTPSYQREFLSPEQAGQNPDRQRSRRSTQHPETDESQHLSSPRQDYRPLARKQKRAVSQPTIDSVRSSRRSSGPSSAYANEREIEPYTTPADAMDQPSEYGGPRPIQDVTGHSRRASATGEPERRRKLADARSPLQRLELTLDSMTKEEKRARVEAAERRARERQARKASLPEGLPPAPAPPPQEQPVPPQIQQPAQQPTQRRSSAAVPRGPREIPPAAALGARRGGSIRDAATQRHVRAVSNYEQQTPERIAQPAVAAVDREQGLPQRNLSFRERTAHADVPLPRDEDFRRASIQRPLSQSEEPSSPSASRINKTFPTEPLARLQQPEAKEPEGQSPQVATPRSGQSFRGHRRQPSGVIEWPVQRNKQLPPDPPLRKQRQPSGDATGQKAPGVPGAPMQGIRRSATEPVHIREFQDEDDYAPAKNGRVTFRGDGPQPQETQPKQEPVEPEGVAAARRRLERQDSAASMQKHRMSGLIFRDPQSLRPGSGLYQSPQWLNEWRDAAVGTLTGSLLDPSSAPEAPPGPEKNKAWWEGGSSRRRSSYPSVPRPAKIKDDLDSKVPTQFSPKLYLRCGPLLRYCGTRTEKGQARTSRGMTPSERTMWRGSVMIVTQDVGSIYKSVPTLRLFAQDLELLPPPPHHVDGELPAEYVDPIAGHPKIGRMGEMLFVRPVEHLEEAKDHSKDETDSGLFEKTRSPPDEAPADGSPDLPGSFVSRRKRSTGDGEKVQKFKEVKGIRLYSDKGLTFWRFNIEVELRDRQQRIAYRINQGPATGFWVPAKGETMNMMFHSCNGFSSNVNPDDLSGPDPLWRDVLNNHQIRPFHLMIGGGDQIYNDSVADKCALFDQWLDIRDPIKKHSAAFTPEMQDQIETFFLHRYCDWFSQGLFSLANSQIPMVNMYDDHDILDGYGSYPHHDMSAPVFAGLGAVAFKYYMLFQHQSIMPETENTEPSWIVGMNTGPYIKELSRSVYVSVGPKVALLAVDTRTERTEHDVVSAQTWEKIMDRLYAEIKRGQVEHLMIVMGVPMAYPRLVWLENILTSRLMDPVKALGRTGMFGKAMNSIDGGVEVIDDLNDHWTAKNHKHERSIIIEDLQDLAIDRSLRITILSGDVHLAAVGSFYSNPKLGLAKHKDPRYMPNIISSAIANAPPPDLVADVLNKRNKVHHFDKSTDEAMIPMFQHGVDGRPRNNKNLLPHRNWCSIRPWIPGHTPPPTPPHSPSPPPSQPSQSGGAAGLLRRLSLSRRNSSVDQTASRDSVRGPKPPISRGGGLFRRLSNSITGREPGPGKLTRSMSLDRGGQPEKKQRGLFGFGRRPRPDDGGINGQWGDEPEDEEPYYYQDPESFTGQARPSGLRGGAASDEYSDGDEQYFSARTPQGPQTLGSQPVQPPAEAEHPPIRPFHRTPTGLSTKQMKKAEHYEVDLEGGLDICLNVEVNPKDPTGITVPYRLLVPKLVYEYSPEHDRLSSDEPTGFKRFLSFRKKEQEQPTPLPPSQPLQRPQQQQEPAFDSREATPEGIRRGSGYGSGPGQGQIAMQRQRAARDEYEEEEEEGDYVYDTRR